MGQRESMPLDSLSNKVNKLNLTSDEKRKPEHNDYEDTPARNTLSNTPFASNSRNQSTAPRIVNSPLAEDAGFKPHAKHISNSLKVKKKRAKMKNACTNYLKSNSNKKSNTKCSSGGGGQHTKPNNNRSTFKNDVELIVRKKLITTTTTLQPLSDANLISVTEAADHSSKCEPGRVSHALNGSAGSLADDENETAQCSNEVNTNK